MMLTLSRLNSVLLFIYEEWAMHGIVNDGEVQTDRYFCFKMCTIMFTTLYGIIGVSALSSVHGRNVLQINMKSSFMLYY